LMHQLSVAKEKAGPDEILEVASRLFSEKGYANVSIRDICKEAKTTPPMIYYYFGSKKGLFQAVTKKKVSMSDFINRLDRASKGPNAESSVRSFVRTYLTSFPEDAFSVGLYLKDTAELDKDNAGKVARGFEQILKMVVGIVEQGIRRGEFRRSDPEMSADILLGLLNHVVFQRLHFERKYNLEKSSEFISDFFVHAMK